MAGTGTQDPLWPRAAELTMPVLVLAEERDKKFVDIGRQLADGIIPGDVRPAGPGAGHAAHLEQPGVVASIIAEFLYNELTPSPNIANDASGSC